MNKILLCSALIVMACVTGASAQTKTVPVLNPTVIESKTAPTVGAMPATASKPVIDRHLTAPSTTSIGLAASSTKPASATTIAVAPKPIMPPSPTTPAPALNVEPQKK